MGVLAVQAFPESQCASSIAGPPVRVARPSKATALSFWSRLDRTALTEQASDGPASFSITMQLCSLGTRWTNQMGAEPRGPIRQEQDPVCGQGVNGHTVHPCHGTQDGLPVDTQTQHAAGGRLMWTGTI